jgi:response regulator RpfG family c-di-GMP phosphodiesterase
MGERKDCVFLLYNLLSDEEAEHIRRELSHHPNFKLETANSPKEVADRLAKGGIDSVIFNLGQCNAKTLKGIEKLKSEHEQVVSVIVCNKAQREVYRAIKNLKGVVILENPIEPGEIERVARKVQGGQEVYYRKHKRYTANQRVVLENIQNGEKHNGMIKNLSKGGAAVEIEAGKVSLGTILKLTIQLDKLSKAHLVHAEVVWVAPGSASEKPSVGLKFMSEDEIYETLFEKAVPQA